MNDEKSLKINVTQGIDIGRVQALEKDINCHVDFIESKGISGETEAWVVIATLTIQALPSVLEFIKWLLDSKKVKSIQYGNLKVDNPTDEMIDAVQRKITEDMEG